MHTIYTRMSRWANSGVLDWAFEQLQRVQVVKIKIEAVSLDSTSVKTYCDGTGGAQKNCLQAIGKSRGGWNTKIHFLAADARTAITFSLFPSQVYDALEDRALIQHTAAGRTDAAF